MFDIKKELSEIHKKGLWRVLRHLGDSQAPQTVIDGKQVVNFSSNNYLNLCGDERLKIAAINACNQYGTGSGASRLLAGGSELHSKLEQEIAEWKGTETSLLFNSGYSANTAIIPAIADADWVVYFDKLDHASIIDGIRLSGAKQAVYKHNDMADLEEKITRFKDKPGLIVTDGVFSMDGDIAPLPDICRLAEKYGLLLMVDDAHATGVLGAKGEGTSSHFGLKDKVHLQMGTLSKALGSEGAFVACSTDFRDLLIQKARGLIFSTVLSPMTVGASLKAVEIVCCHPEMSGQLREKTISFKSLLAKQGINVPSGPVPIIPLIVGDPAKATEISKNLLNEGYYVPAIRPPTVPEGTSRLRISISLGHTDSMLEKVAGILHKMLASISALKQHE